VDLFFWEIARASGLAAYAALCIAVLSGLAPRTQALSFLANNRAVRALHDFTPWIVVPAALTHIVALLLDATARIGVLDVVVPFRTSYGQLAIGLGTITVDLLIVVLVTTWMRRRMSNNAWQWWHRVSYVGFVTMFLHAMLSGTDLTSPVIAALSWASAIGIGYYALERLGKALNPARIRAQGLHSGGSLARTNQYEWAASFGGRSRELSRQDPDLQGLRAGIHLDRRRAGVLRKPRTPERSHSLPR
jgi:sulfoxide reductase heme-binding subunit YedZ